MNLKHVTDQTLHADLVRHVGRERELLIVILHHLREIERRRLFAVYRRASLHEYAVKELGYSDDQACRRISAMRLMKELPEIEEKIAAGSLTLSNLGMAHSLFRSEAKEPALAAGAKPTVRNLEAHGFSKSEKLEILTSLEGKSAREAKRVVLANVTAPEKVFAERVHPLNTHLDQIQIAVPIELTKKLERLKGLKAHQHPCLDLAKLIELMADLALEAWDPAREPSLKRESPATSRVVSRYVAAATRRTVWKQGERKCQGCDSTQGLQIDHRKPYAKGGETREDNLRLLCRSCNQRAAIEQFGLRKMESYFARSPSRRYIV